MEYFLLLWPLCGWVCGYLSTPKWMFDEEPFDYVVVFICGAIVGPFGIFWFLDQTGKEP